MFCNGMDVESLYEANAVFFSEQSREESRTPKEQLEKNIPTALEVKLEVRYEIGLKGFFFVLFSRQLNFELTRLC